MGERIFGHVSNIPVGQWFASRKELSEAGVHRPTQAGISGSEKEGADSIVLSGGYEDDLDLGNEIIYTGQGGRDPGSGQQVKHQQLNRGNLALAKSRQDGLPVRVIRRLEDSGYRYDGLYRVADCWQERGQAGYFIWRYQLIKVEDEFSGLVAEPSQGYERPERQETTVLRIVRDTAQARWIKKLYNYRCQVCGTRLEGAAGPYAEAAHIRSLGAPHNGPDTRDNLICLCPNHHVLFDFGGFTIADDFSLIGLEGQLYVHSRHRLNPEHLHYHREHHFAEREKE